jgi:glycosyltransferase involved in cell wall biosynthesis
MNSEPLVSVIIPFFNRSTLLPYTIESVIRQTYQNLEIILVDDGSNDNSLDLAFKYSGSDPRIRVFIRPGYLPKGANTCRNFGLEMAKGIFVKWLDSDDIVAEDCVAKQLFEFEPDLDVVACRTCQFESSSGLDAAISKKYWGGNRKNKVSITNYLMHGYKWHTGSGLWRKSWFNNKSPFDLDLQNSQEWLMHLHQVIDGIKLKIIEEELVFARVHPGSMSNRLNKKAAYFYYEAIARKKALIYLRKNNKLKFLFRLKLLKSYSWFHLFVLKNLGFRYGIKLLFGYSRFFWI